MSITDRDLRAFLKENNPLYSDSDDVYCITDENLYLGWRTGASVSPLNYFYAQVTNGTFYLLSIEIEPRHRGKGVGRKLYESMEALAKKLGCFRIEMTASGRTPLGETRKAYLCRKFGYKSDGTEVVYKDVQV